MVNNPRARISPTAVSPENRLCSEFFAILQQLPVNVEPALGHRSICFACGISILWARTHLVHHNCPERNEIIRWTLPYLVPHLTRVCNACWIAARRNVQRQINQDFNKTVEEFNDTPLIPVAPPLSLNVVPQPSQQEPQRIVSQSHTRAASTSKNCMFPGCENVEHLMVPRKVKELLLCRHRFYVPPSARVCQYHKENNCWEQLNSNIRDFTVFHIDVKYDGES